ncbi:MAG TPA: (2Fe-2S)-binding protein [Steroidobacteraceae bacterium]|nr:(2Fe-2S)-binding protein [Steroidobacteraceae bacterium]HNS27567.1 (2Fe-2S)-binding protein [Steroidobacteraceae bacterium]
MTYRLHINGQVHAIDVPGEMPLLWVLRDSLGLVGTKYGCGMALCGACTVHVDGVPQRSCRLPVSSVGDSEITTIEHIGSTEIGARLQKAWLDTDVMQCGYCQAGQIMSAAAMLAVTPKPSHAEIRATMAGNICRCACYNRIENAIRIAAGLEPGGESHDKEHTDVV